MTAARDGAAARAAPGGTGRPAASRRHERDAEQGGDGQASGDAGCGAVRAVERGSLGVLSWIGRTTRTGLLPGDARNPPAGGPRGTWREGREDGPGYGPGSFRRPRRGEPLAPARCSGSPSVARTDPGDERPTVAGQRRNRTGFPWTSDACCSVVTAPCGRRRNLTTRRPRVKGTRLPGAPHPRAQTRRAASAARPGRRRRCRVHPARMRPRSR